MKINKLHLLSLLIPAAIALGSCSSDDDDTSVDNSQLQTDILSNVATNVCQASYEEMYTKGQTLQTAIATLNTTTTDANLAAAQEAWKDMRITWESSEAWLFGPVEADNIDPRIDSWPIDFNTFKTDVLDYTGELTDAYINGLGDEVKGFHPIEYLLWGTGGTKKASDITAHEKLALTALVTNLLSLTQDAKDTWQGGYAQQLATAGNGSTEFSSQKEAFLQIVQGMADICDEVANSKISGPYNAIDPSKEESPYSKNSFTDFTNNIKGILLIYQGQFSGAKGKGLDDLVKTTNGTLDGQIKAAVDNAVTALNISVPFGQAITDQNAQVPNAVEKINTLATLLTTDLTNFVQQYVK